MKVLILHQHFRTPEQGGAIRSYYLARALADAGITPIVITGSNEKKYVVKYLEGIEIHYLPVPYDNKYGFGARGSSFLKFAWSSVRVARRIKDIDVCYAISVPLTIGLPAWWLKFRGGLPFFFEVGDLWPDAPIQMEFVQNFLLKKILYALEKAFYKKAEAVIALSPAIQSAIEEKVPGKKVIQVPNMADCDYYKPEQKNPKTDAHYKTNGKFVVSYIGAVGAANGLDYFLECANATRKSDLAVHFLLCGEGALLERLKKNAAQLALQNLTFVDFQNREGVREVLNITDAAFVCYKHLPILETGSPNKFFDGLAAGKLILINFDGWIRKEIETNRCGLYLDPRKPEEFVKKVKPFLDNVTLLTDYQRASRALAERKYSRRILGEKFVSLFQREKIH